MKIKVVPFEVAQALKEAGFDEIVSYIYYTNERNKTQLYQMTGKNSILRLCEVAAPAYQEVIEWLEGKGLILAAMYNGYNKWFAELFGEDRVIGSKTGRTRWEALDEAIKDTCHYLTKKGE